MGRHVLLNNVDHRDLRLLDRHGPTFGDNQSMVPVFPTEFADVQREYPIFFRKEDPSNEYQAVALLGLVRGENLFVRDGAWHARYVPGFVVRGPFLIGFQEQQVDGQLVREPVIHVDPEHPRLSFSEGTPLFRPGGGNGPLLEHIATVLRGIRDGMEIARPLYAAWAALDLFEPVKLDVRISEVQGFNVLGLHTLSRDRLSALDGPALQNLNQAGFLEGAFLVCASTGNVRRLIDLKIRSLQGP